MGVKTFKPITPGRRFMVVSSFEEITRTKPEKSLTIKLKKKSGRNNHGHVTVRHQGGGHKRKYRIIDFKRNKDNIPAKVAAIEYDPNRSARIALLNYADGEKRYIIAPNGLKVGNTVMSGTKIDIVLGNCMPMRSIPTGTEIHCIELKVGKGAQMVRSAGSRATLVAKEGDYGMLRMPSSEIRKVHLDCRATIGQVGNLEHESLAIGKAGRNRWLGKRPSVRGVAMNPCDHPLGGGEGKTSGGRNPVTPWGQPTRGYKTRKKRKWTNKFIVKRRTK